MRRGLVGIAGAPGSGKSTIAESWAERMNAAGWPAAVLPMDGFHLPQARLVDLGRRERMGAPDTFDVEGFVALLTRLRAGEPVRAPLFDRTVEEAVPDALEIGAGVRTVVVEGNYLLHDGDGWGRVAPLLDLRVFLAEDEDERVRRLIARHIAFGKTPEAARDWALGTDQRNAELIAAGRPRADLIVAVD